MHKFSAGSNSFSSNVEELLGISADRQKIGEALRLPFLPEAASITKGKEETKKMCDRCEALDRGERMEIGSDTGISMWVEKNGYGVSTLYAQSSSTDHYHSDGYECAEDIEYCPFCGERL